MISQPIEQLNEANSEEEWHYLGSKKHKKTNYSISKMYTNNNYSSFLELSESRFSVREYSQKPVE